MVGVVWFGLAVTAALTLLYGIDPDRELIQVNQNLSGVTEVPICEVWTKESQIALSFDVGRSDGNIEELLPVLQKNGAKATFFISGQWAEQHSETVKEICEAGYELGSCGQSYTNMRLLSGEECREEILKAHDLVEQLTGYEMTVFRPPFGEYDNHVIDSARKCGYCTVQGNVDSLDWKDYGVDAVIQTVLEHPELDRGSILLFHSGAVYTAEAVDEIIAELQGRGYDLVSVSQLLASAAVSE